MYTLAILIAFAYDIFGSKYHWVINIGIGAHLTAKKLYPHIDQHFVSSAFVTAYHCLITVI